MVVRGGIEPPTRGFSVSCHSMWLKLLYTLTPRVHDVDAAIRPERNVVCEAELPIVVAKTPDTPEHMSV
jgi:hypothetical protein